MAEVEIEKRSSMWPWLLAGLALLLVMGFFFLGTDGDHATVAGDPATTTTQPTTPRATDDMRTETTFPTGPGGLLVILTEPAVYLDQPVEGTALVAESVGDRGF